MTKNLSEIIRAHVWAKGHVQGVGFRAHVEYHAEKIGKLTGWVRNVGSNVVEIVAEGQRDPIERLIEMIEQGPRMSRVDDVTVEWETATGEYKSFGVKPTSR